MSVQQGSICGFLSLSNFSWLLGTRRGVEQISKNSAFFPRTATEIVDTMYLRKKSLVSKRASLQWNVLGGSEGDSEGDSLESSRL